MCHLESVLQTLQQHQHVLFARCSKCCLGLLEVEYLRYTVSGNGVAMETSEIQSVLEWQRPVSIKHLQGFLGLTGYYRLFINSYVMIIGPLTDLLKEDSFCWTEAADQAFIKLKQVITSVPVLALPIFSQPFVLETDACGISLAQCYVKIPLCISPRSWRIECKINLHTPESCLLSQQHSQNFKIIC